MTAKRVYTDAEVDAIVATHTAIAAAHHVKYTDAEVDAIVATHTAIAAAHHVKYTDAEVDAIVATHTAIAAAHHVKYIDAEAVSALDLEDAYLKNDADDITSGIITAKDVKILNPYQNFQVLDRPALSNAGDGGVTVGTFYTHINSGAVNGNEHYLYTGANYTLPPWVMATKLSMGTATENSEMWAIWALDTITTPTNSCIHFGFKIVNGDIYATNGNGTNGTQTDLSIHLDQWGSKNVTVTYGSTAIKFYVSGSLVATHTTNIPAAGQKRIFCYCKTNTNTNKTFSLLDLRVQNR